MSNEIPIHITSYLAPPEAVRILMQAMDLTPEEVTAWEGVIAECERRRNTLLFVSGRTVSVLSEDERP